MSSDTDTRRLVILWPAPQRADRIFSSVAREQLEREFRLVDLEDEPEDAIDAYLPEAFAIIGQPALPQARLARAPNLRAIVNVEGNFFPNIDYVECFTRGVYVLGCGPAFAQAVAEYALGLAIDLARGISREDRAFRAGTERYVSDSTVDSVLLRGAALGIVGFGNLGRALVELLRPFHPTLRVNDPWLPDSVLREHSVLPSSLDETVSQSQFLFVLATVTEETEHLLGERELALAPEGARWILVSRAAVVDYDALFRHVEDGRIYAGVDVWPQEPAPIDHPARSLDGLVLSAHRAGGIEPAFLAIGEMVIDDLRQLNRGLPPVRMQIAAREIVGRYRNRPVT